MLALPEALAAQPVCPLRLSEEPLTYSGEAPAGRHTASLVSAGGMSQLILDWTTRNSSKRAGQQSERGRHSQGKLCFKTYRDQDPVRDGR